MYLIFQVSLQVHAKAHFGSITKWFILGYVVRRLVIIIIIIINNQILRKIKIAVESDVKNWAYISLR